jgi:hypothetical protein
MAQSLKRIALTAAACGVIASPLAAAQAQPGYEYLFWPLINAAPAPTPAAPAQVRTQAPASAPTPVAAPRHAQPDYIQETAEIRYAPSGPIGRPAYGGAPQAVILGVGY